MKDDRLYLIHIKESIEWIEDFTQAGSEVFFEDRKTQDAVLRNLQTLSESTQRLSSDIKEAWPLTDWLAISNFRNVVVHDYLGIDLDQIWDIVHNDLPHLKQVILKMIDEQNPAR